MENLFDKAMAGIGEKVALQEIRKVLRGKLPEPAKLESIISIVETYEQYRHRTYLDAEDRAMKEEEAEMRKQRMEEDLEAVLEPLTIRKGEKHDP